MYQTKSKKKFRNAKDARTARELDASWKELQEKWGIEAEDKKGVALWLQKHWFII